MLQFQLSALALDWANQLLEADKFSHRPDNKFGENIFFYTSSFYVDDKEAIKKAVTAWYNEIEDYREYFDLEPPLEALTTGNPTGEKFCVLPNPNFIYSRKLFFCLSPFLLFVRYVTPSVNDRDSITMSNAVCGSNNPSWSTKVQNKLKKTEDHNPVYLYQLLFYQAYFYNM